MYMVESKTVGGLTRGWAPLFSFSFEEEGSTDAMPKKPYHQGS
jgi:hypothetical protein